MEKWILEHTLLLSPNQTHILELSIMWELLNNPVRFWASPSRCSMSPKHLRRVLGKRKSKKTPSNKQANTNPTKKLNKQWKKKKKRKRKRKNPPTSLYQSSFTELWKQQDKINIEWEGKKPVLHQILAPGPTTAKMRWHAAIHEWTTCQLHTGSLHRHTCPLTGSLPLQTQC